MCNEVNVMRFGDESIFGTTGEAPAGLLISVSETHNGGWASMDFSYTADLKDGLGKVPRHNDSEGLVGLPVIGFAAYEFENGFLGVPGDTVLANYGGLFGHKSSVRKCNVIEAGKYEGACSSL
jgi:hypothetical protein